MAQQPSGHGISHINALGVSVTWTNDAITPQAVGHHSQQQHTDAEMATDDSHLLGMAMPSRIQHPQQPMAYAQHQHQLRQQQQAAHPQAAQMQHHHALQQHATMLQHQHQPAVVDMASPDPSAPSTLSFTAPEEDRSDSCNNEMRTLFNENRHKSLEDVARMLQSNDKGPASERLRQIFAMLWLDRLCQRSSSSVPRGRVYGSYASRCANHGITVLNPASFGKLVRILYPGLRTRRLGVRGESKYHYVNFELKEDAENAGNDQQISAFAAEADAFAARTTASTAPHPTNSVADLPAECVMRAKASHGKSREGARVIFEPGQNLLQVVSSTGTTPRVESSYSRNFPQPKTAVSTEPIVLPPMAPHLDSGTDPDALTTLEALYRAHCTALVDSLRFCREKAFFHQVTSFQGTLTVPVQRLLFSSRMAQWIEHADTVLYQRLMDIVDFLLLQAMPEPVIKCISNIGLNLVAHLRKSFSSFPSHALNAKLVPATVFCSLVSQAMRVNMTAHAAADNLTCAQLRSAMYADLVRSVDVCRLVQTLPKRAVDDFIAMCATRVRKTIDPAEVDAELEAKTIFAQATNRDGGEMHGTAADGASNPLDVWSRFVLDLPDMFPYASAKELVEYTHIVLSTVARDITMLRGESFTTWWVTKCWIEEYIIYLASAASFMDRFKAAGEGDSQCVSERENVAVSKQASLAVPEQASLAVPKQGDGLAETADEAARDQPTEAQKDEELQKNEARAANAAVGEAARGGSGDDSGIGIRTPEEEYRYEFGHGEQAEMEEAPETM
ncbi:hypothetical protein TD95_000194 [Thielaviopsis punctulata]|uniref:RFX-type winged-helix domain-containing protein n=1 Tax=Thielaviopsis punctulata TaxID=72032 RepID=A0A0F4ZDP6_9PEZI|nr:hypothetical protein TD95_000194 [Thielaviopsis punctulata]